MPLFDQIETYSVYVARNDLGHNRVISLKLQSGETARIEFPDVVPDDWLQFIGSATNLYMAVDEFDNVYRLLREETPVFFTALDLAGLRVGAVHTQLDLDAGQVPGDEDEESQSLEALLRRAKRQAEGAG